MNRSWWAKFALLMFFTVLSVIYVYPTLARLDLENTKFPFKQKINLGLDLQGGLYMVLGVDFNKVFKDIVDRQASALEGRLKEKGIPVKNVKVVREGLPVEDPHITFEFDIAKNDEVRNIIKDEFWTLRMVGDKPGNYEVGLSREFRVDVRDRTMNQSIEVIRNRIDEFGVTEPSIVSQGTDRLVVELPGVKDIERAKGLIGRTAKLEFKIVDDKAMAPDQVAALVNEIEQKQNITFKEGQKFSDYVAKLNEHAKGRIPEGDEIAFERSTVPGMPATRIPYLLHSKVDVTGEELADANVNFDQETRRPNVGFQMNPRGATMFGKLTGDNIGRRLAIVLDNIVHSAPVIQSKISENGQITLGQGDPDALMKEAKDLAIVLRAGALPAQLDFLEQRVVGPSLGSDSIKKGAIASAVGILMVFLFAGVYYRKSGVIAIISLLLNVLFVLAILVGMEATLTLPGIAGIALTIGMAVDSNIIIFERIRDEVRAGKQLHGAIEAGFQKAFSAILDSNITTAAAAVVLLMYGTGPIKGFAVTLLIGIVTTVFAAVFVCRLMFDLYLKRLQDKGQQTISI